MQFSEFWQICTLWHPPHDQDIEHFFHPWDFPYAPSQSGPTHGNPCSDFSLHRLRFNFVQVESDSVYFLVRGFICAASVCDTHVVSVSVVCSSHLLSGIPSYGYTCPTICSFLLLRDIWFFSGCSATVRKAATNISVQRKCTDLLCGITYWFLLSRLQGV